MATFYSIATPIGNLEDVTLRAFRILGEVDVVIAEDTRVTSKLLSHYKTSKRLIAWNEHSGEKQWRDIKALLEQGKDLAYVTDAGTPGVSDPGGKLVALILKELSTTQIVAIPGPSALAAAISVAGIPLQEFLFLAFLPHKKGRQTLLKEIAASERPVIVYESVHRIRKLLTELLPMSKHVIVCRELTKKFETVYRGTPAAILEKLVPAETKGEFVVIIY